MNSRERRKLEALQHNDAIRYEKWLIDNTRNQIGSSSKRNLKSALCLLSAFALLNARDRHIEYKV